MSTILDQDSIHEAYESVRDDANDITWVLLGFEDQRVVVSSQGSDYNEFLNSLSDEERCFAYVRIMTGDEMSKRAKFAFITWAGANISPIKKARLSVDKGLVKSVIRNFAVEILAQDRSDVELSAVEECVRRAGGANYGTGR